MRFGKSFADTLENSQFPPEWKEGAIKYNRVCFILVDRWLTPRS